MPEEGIETQDIKEQMETAQEHAEKAHEGGHHAGAGTRWLTWLSLSTACLAALAAVASLHAGGLANEALLLKSDAVLAQSEYADNWSEYQARSMKAYLFDTQAALLQDEPRKSAESHAHHEREEADRLKPVAERLRHKVEGSNEASAQRMERHEIFARAVTIFQIAIAVAAIAALTRRKAMWWLSMVGGAAGVGLLIMGFTGAAGGEKRGGEASGAAEPAPSVHEK